MSDGSSEGTAVRSADAATLAAALAASRRDTLATFAAFERALDGLAVPRRPELNPPLWELGHVGWFQEFWTSRFPERARGIHANPSAPRSEGVRSGADALYDSSRVPHDARWALALPDARATRSDLEAQLERTQRLLALAGKDDEALYFFRLVLLHEDMHHEAALYMAQALGVAIDDARWRPAPLPEACTEIEFEAGPWRTGSSGPGFAFDNECRAHEVAVPASRIDCRVVRWAEYLPFVEAGGYHEERWWSAAGRSWLEQTRATAPRFLARSPGRWLRCWHGRWAALDPALPACHLTHHEAQAWCRWASRRLPGEAEWERAAVLAPDRFEWGQVWEWTASRFGPYPGFVAHPYREYSAPWFDGRPVLRGASFATQARLRHPRYRNYFSPERNDVFAGFRSCRV
jgi:ergothioneine biosynthesis protein EgtB